MLKHRVGCVSDPCDCFAQVPNVAFINAPDVQRQLVALLRDALVIAEGGDMTGVVVCFTTRSRPGSVTTFRQCEDGLRLLGALRVAADDVSDWLRDKE
jgi:hypothetical protein